MRPELAEIVREFESASARLHELERTLAPGSWSRRPAPDSWSRLDVDGAPRMTAGAGLGVELGRWRLDVGGSVIEEPHRSLRDVAMEDPSDTSARVQPDIGVPLASPDDQPYNPFNAGAYDGSYWIASVGLVRRL